MEVLGTIDKPTHFGIQYTAGKPFWHDGGMALPEATSRSKTSRTSSQAPEMPWPNSHNPRIQMAAKGLQARLVAYILT